MKQKIKDILFETRMIGGFLTIFVGMLYIGSKIFMILEAPFRVSEKDSHTIIPKEKQEQVLEEEPEFMDIGEHAIAVDYDIDVDMQQQLSVPDGYELRGIVKDSGISSVLYVNTKPVLCKPTGVTKDGEPDYGDLCTPVEEQPLIESYEDVRDFEVGEHVITAPIRVDTYGRKTMQFEYHEGYEVISMTASTSGRYVHDDDGCIVYRNVVPVRATATAVDSSGYIFGDFGVLIEKGKVKTR